MYVPMSNTTQDGKPPALVPLNEEAALAGIDLLRADDSALEDCMVRRGILRPVIVEGRELHEFCSEAYTRHFMDVTYVIFGAQVRAVLGRDEMVCTCGNFSHFRQCQHLLFAQGLALPGRPPTRDFSAVPSSRKRGRPSATKKTEEETKKARAPTALQRPGSEDAD